MKKRNLTSRFKFRVSELYLFHPNNPHCPSQSSLWGFYDRSKGGIIYLEHSSRNLCNFRLWHPLSRHYRYCRKATRAELRDYMYNMGYSDSNKKQGFSLKISKKPFEMP